MVDEAIVALLAKPGTTIAVDLEATTVAMPDGNTYGFAIDPFAKYCVLQGLDELDYTLSQLEHIAAFERNYEAASLQRPAQQKIVGKP